MPRSCQRRFRTGFRLIEQVFGSSLEFMIHPDANLEDRHEVERIRRSVAMLPPGSPALNREDALRVLRRLMELTG